MVSVPAAAFSLDRIYEAQRQNREQVAASTAGERREKLLRIERAMMARRDEIRAAMWDDYRKPAAEVDLSEIYAVVGEARHAARHIRRWTAPHRAHAPLALLGSSSRIVYEAKGVVLIISPWNFPFNLSLGPLVSAVAAGNCVILKPSEMTPHSSACIKRIVNDLFDDSEVAVIEGDARVAEALLRKKFDHIFFTGSPAVGKIVMKAAAEHLTPVTLELGGKSPVIVDRTADLDEAAKKIAWGKFFNSGQVCIAPDYLLVDESVRIPFVEKLLGAIRSMEAEGSRGVIVNERHAARIRKLYDSAVAGGAELIAGGLFGSDARAIAPTVLANVSADSPVMQEEIFGPLLPMLTYSSLDEAIHFINDREKPLVSYLFSRSRRVIRHVLSRTTAGATVINHTLIHFFQLNLPFGGVGQSGIGKGHGFFGFQTFSNARAVLEQRTRLSPIELMFPPYTKFKQKLIDITLKYF
ncbi:MAG TPA: aldehyde dehydrogenase family protein [Thermoanaerobaculia bacterium]|nr:aldehyde dehydrogenase family protein [Thermoanaerobaculia bacterium]